MWYYDFVGIFLNILFSQSVHFFLIDQWGQASFSFPFQFVARFRRATQRCRHVGFSRQGPEMSIVHVTRPRWQMGWTPAGASDNRPLFGGHRTNRWAKNWLGIKFASPQHGVDLLYVLVHIIFLHLQHMPVTVVRRDFSTFSFVPQERSAHWTFASTA